MLIGGMGAGKSAVGAALAARLRRPLLDTDRMVEEEARISVADIFERDGEVGFRKLEREAVARVCAVEGAVIACGGGAVLDPQNLEALRAVGDLIWLRVSADVALRRLQTSREARPLLAKRSLEEIDSERRTLYESAADFEVDAEGQVDEVAGRVLSILE